MAARETQVLHIALIVFVGLTVVLFVVSFFIFRSYQEEQVRSKTAEAAKVSSEKATRTAVTESESLKNMIGAGSRDTLETINDAYNKDMQKYGANFPPAKRNYRNVIEYVQNQFVAADQGRIEVADKVKELEAKLETMKQEQLAEIAKYTAGQTKSDKDLALERAAFNQHKAAIDKDKTQLAAQLDDKGKEVEEIAKKKNEEMQKLAGEHTKLQTTHDKLLAERQEKLEAAELPDGAVTWVNQHSRTVWINRGSEDGLRKQVSFSVLGKEETNPATAEKKGKLEVINIVNGHMAECRIVDDKYNNPIMPGDQIFSPVWQPGQKEHFALAGFMDINEDGISDRKLIRDLIVLNGGVIDAEAGDDGTKTGEVTVGTRYLVLGERLTDTTKQDVIKAFSAVLKEAQTAGVPTMSLTDFLNYMGYKPEERSVQLGKEGQDLAAQKQARKNAKANEPAPVVEKKPFKPRLPTAGKRGTF